MIAPGVRMEEIRSMRDYPHLAVQNDRSFAQIWLAGASRAEGFQADRKHLCRRFATAGTRPLMLILIWAGNVPSAILRKMVDRDSPHLARTVFRRTIRSGAGMGLPPAGCF